MNYQCANFYTTIPTNKDTADIFPFLSIFAHNFYFFTPKIANCGPIVCYTDRHL